MMGKLVDRMQAAPPMLWLGSHAYGARLLANDNPPWLDAAAFVAWQGKLLGLLRPDVAELPLAPIVAAWLGVHPALRDSMAVRSRAIVPLRTLLADEALRRHLLDLAKAFRSAIRIPLTLVLPSPRAWVALAYRQAHGTETEVGEDEIDGASVYIADFLRSFGDSGMDAVLLEEATGDGPIDAGTVELYRPVLNVAAHYQWDIGLRMVEASATAGGFDFVIGASVSGSGRHAVETDPKFWSDAAPSAVAAGDFRYAEIPASAMPERVLERLSILKDVSSPH